MTDNDLAHAAGVNLLDVAKYWPHPRYKITQKTLEGRVRRIRRATRHGGLNDRAACHLAHLLKRSPIIFLRGYEAARGMLGAGEVRRDGLGA